MSNRAIGNQGEELAVKYLQQLGYKILERNYQIKGGEIDIIAMERGELVLVEVKTRYSHQFGAPLESVTPWKLKHILKSALFYLNKISWGDKPYRIDVLAIDYADDRGNPKIELLKSVTS